MIFINFALRIIYILGKLPDILFIIKKIALLTFYISVTWQYIQLLVATLFAFTLVPPLPFAIFVYF